MKELTTDRLRLRMLREFDLDAYAAMCADPDIMRYLGEGKQLSRAESWRNMATVLGHWQLRGYGLWAVEDQSGTFVGRIGCWRPDGWPGFEIGWTLRKEYWGRGYATEGARAAIQFAFDNLNQDRVISLIQPANLASIRVAERIGEKLIERADVMGKECLKYGISRDEWKAFQLTG